ncbi:peptide methionine sulfoxide reductase [Aquimarina litoralis]|uniref:peptide methionine sulfoxide reductase n=1 Tax=Aquimarina litoralis TaxID=584605 RepID=UPI001C573B22|nr:peptide methionine sulfoxide reductase [Aquimarina litoralis]MBW1296474.1 peptide methionine sulfoxide reductase [Aquimarina litoralis]
MTLLDYIHRIPEGYSEVLYDNKKYGVTKDIFNKGKSFKIYAKELQGKDFISLNYYITSTSQLLKPCEMPEKKVIDFLEGFNFF